MDSRAMAQRRRSRLPRHTPDTALSPWSDQRPWPPRTRPTRDMSANAGEQERSVLLQHLARDDEALDLVRPFVDLRDLRVAHHPLDWVLLDVAVAAEDLHRIGGDLHGDVAAVELRHRRDLRQLLPVGSLVDQLPTAVE